MLTSKALIKLSLGVAVIILSGCQTTDYDAIRQVSNATPQPEGRQLGGGFIQGMSPEQTCIHFRDHYKTSKNILCGSIGSKDFANLTVINQKITEAPGRNNRIRAIAFYFDDEKKLSLVQSVQARDDYMSVKRSQWGLRNQRRPDEIKPRARKIN